MFNLLPVEKHLPQWSMQSVIGFIRQNTRIIKPMTDSMSTGASVFKFNGEKVIVTYKCKYTESRIDGFSSIFSPSKLRTDASMKPRLPPLKLELSLP